MGHASGKEEGPGPGDRGPGLDSHPMITDVRDEPSDEELLRRVASHDVDALTALYDRHRSVAYAVALRVTRSVPAAEDAVQEAFLGLWRNRSGFDPGRGSGRSWLLAVVHHRAIDLLRRRRASDPLPEAGASTPEALVAPDVWPEVAGRLDAAAIREALAGLSDVQREAIELAYWGGLSQSEIAARTAVPLGTVKGRLRLGLMALGRALAGGGDSDDLLPADGDARSGPRGIRPEVGTDTGAERSLMALAARAAALLAGLLGPRLQPAWIR